jgi:ribosomal protein S16
VVAPHTNAVKGKYVELLGHYVPAAKTKAFDVKKDRVEYWITKGAKPSASMAAILKKHGFANMDQYIPVRAKTERPKKKDAGKAPAAAPKAAPAEAKPAA